MTASTAMKLQVRRWTNEPSTTTYSDADIAAYIEKYPLQDERGVDPYYYDTSTDPPTQVAVTGWYPTYDLHSAAADIWENKASLLAAKVDIPHELPIQGYDKQTQPRDFALTQARYHRSHRTVKTANVIQSPSRRRRGDTEWIGNLSEDWYDY